jgi:hypothetical protein
MGIMGAERTKGVQRMKKYNAIICILTLACAGIGLVSCETTQSGAAAAAPPNSGHVLIYRVANFGEDLGLVVSVDGKDVGTFTEGRNYSGYLPAGQHRLTVRVDPNRTGAGPGRKALTVRAGQTYVYTAAWSGENLALVRGH